MLHHFVPIVTIKQELVIDIKVFDDSDYLDEHNQQIWDDEQGSKMLCRLCQGAGNFFCQQPGGGKEWWVCQACGGAGTRILFGPPMISMGKVQGEVVNRALTKTERERNCKNVQLCIKYLLVNCHSLLYIFGD